MCVKMASGQLGMHRRSTRPLVPTYLLLAMVSSLEVSARVGNVRPSRQEAARCNVDVCRLPACLCASDTAPGGVRRDQLPQIVTFTFDDAVNAEVFDYYEVRTT